MGGCKEGKPNRTEGLRWPDNGTMLHLTLRSCQNDQDDVMTGEHLVGYSFDNANIVDA